MICSNFFNNFAPFITSHKHDSSCIRLIIFGCSRYLIFMSINTCFRLALQSFNIEHRKRLRASKHSGGPMCCTRRCILEVASFLGRDGVTNASCGEYKFSTLSKALSVEV